MKADVYNLKGKATGEVALDDAVFGAEVGAGKKSFA